MEQEETRKVKAGKAKLVRSFSLTPIDMIDVLWSRVVPHLLKGEKHWRMFYSLEQIKENLFAGHQQLWCAIEGPNVIGVVITQLDRYPEVCMLRFQYLGGKGFDPSYMLPWVRKMEIWAMHNGASGVDFVGRDAYMKLLVKNGYQCVGRVYRKQLINDNNISRRMQ